MMLFSKVLVAYDGSNLSKKALKHAVNIVQESNDPFKSATLTVVHVTHAPIYSFAAASAPFYTASMDFVQHDDPILDEVRGLVPSTLGANYVSKKGQPAFTILEYAEEHKCDLIVMGSRGLGTIREFFLGSVSHNVAQNSKVPVLIVK
jgi:nucleotide-binding universal stress UspA family protein